MERKSKDFFPTSGDFSGRNKEPELPWETFINNTVVQYSIWKRKQTLTSCVHIWKNGLQLRGFIYVNL